MNETKTITPLAELSDYGLKHDDQDIRGKTLMSASGAELGKIVDMLVDDKRECVVAVQLDDGTSHPVKQLERRGDDVYVCQTGTTATAGTDGDQRIPILEEQLRIGKRTVDKGSVRIQSRVVETPVTEQVTLREEHVTTERRPIGSKAGEMGADAFEERTITMTETAEQAVIAKDARVVEEVVVGKTVENRVEQVKDTLRHTEVEIEDTRGKAPPAR